MSELLERLEAQFLENQQTISGLTNKLLALGFNNAEISILTHKAITSFESTDETPTAD